MFAHGDDDVREPVYDLTLPPTTAMEHTNAGVGSGMEKGEEQTYHVDPKWSGKFLSALRLQLMCECMPPPHSMDGGNMFLACSCVTPCVQPKYFYSNILRNITQIFTKVTAVMYFETKTTFHINLGVKGQSSKSWWNRICWKHHFEGGGIEYLTSENSVYVLASLSC